MQAPVEDRQRHGLVGGRVGRALQPQGGRRVDVVGQWLGHPVEHQPDAHTGAEQHGQPGPEAELGFLDVPAEPDGADP